MECLHYENSIMLQIRKSHALWDIDVSRGVLNWNWLSHCPLLLQINDKNLYFYEVRLEWSTLYPILGLCFACEAIEKCSNMLSFHNRELRFTSSIRPWFMCYTTPLALSKDSFSNHNSDVTWWLYNISAMTSVRRCECIVTLFFSTVKRVICHF
jgi:hypothetical protein